MKSCNSTSCSFEILLGSGGRMMDSGLQRFILKGLGLSLCAVPS
jgi:hypothetical protein